MISVILRLFTFTLEAWNRSRTEFEANRGIKDVEELKNVRRIRNHEASFIPLEN